MVTIPKTVLIILFSAIILILFVLVCVNLFKSEYDDPPYNYLSKNWLNSPIKEIEILDQSEDTKINEQDCQKNLGYFKSGSTKKDLNVFLGKYFKIKLYTPYYYPNFVGYFHKKDDNKICGKDSQGNLLYFPKNEECPINFISIENDDSICTTNNINCKKQGLNNGLFLLTSNENINGEIITQLRINYNEKICADSSVDLTFNDLLNNYDGKNCKEEYGYDKIYHKIGEESVEDFLNENNLKNMEIKKSDNIFLSYRSYLGVDDIDKFKEHPVDHVTYAKKISLSKNIILFISCFFYAFCSIFILYFNDKIKYNCTIKVIFIIYCVLFAFNFFYQFHVIFTFRRVKGIVTTVNLKGIEIYKNGIRWFIIIDIIILILIACDFVIKLLQFLMFCEANKIDETKIIPMDSNPQN